MTCDAVLFVQHVDAASHAPPRTPPNRPASPLFVSIVDGALEIVDHGKQAGHQLLGRTGLSRLRAARAVRRRYVSHSACRRTNLSCHSSASAWAFASALAASVSGKRLRQGREPPLSASVVDLGLNGFRRRVARGPAGGSRPVGVGCGGGVSARFAGGGVGNRRPASVMRRRKLQTWRLFLSRASPWLITSLPSYRRRPRRPRSRPRWCRRPERSRQPQPARRQPRLQWSTRPRPACSQRPAASR